MSDEERPGPPGTPDGNDETLITAPIKEIERKERRAFFAQHRKLFLSVALVSFALVVVAGSIGFLVGRVGEENELVEVSDGRAPAGANASLTPVESEVVLASFFSGVLQARGGSREAATLRFGGAQVEGKGWLQTEYVLNRSSTRERGVALLQPSATRLLLGSGESLEVGRNAQGHLIVRGGEGRRLRLRSESP